MIREFEERDAEGAAALLQDLPWLTTPETILHRSRTLPARARARSWVAEEEGAIVGWAQTQFKWTTERDDVTEVWAFVRPDRRGAGIGTRLYELAAAHVVEHGARELESGAWEEAGRRFLSRRSYERTREARFSALDPRTVDTSALALPEGFRLVTLADLRGAGGEARDDQLVRGARRRAPGDGKRLDQRGHARDQQRVGLPALDDQARLRADARPVIRDFEAGDAEGVAGLLCDLPWFVTAELLRHRLRTTPPRAHARRWIAKEKDEIVGWAQTMFEWESASVDVAAVWVFVAPDRRGAGIGSRLYELAVGHSLEHGARELKSGAWEDEGDRFLVTRGYESTREQRFSALDPRTVDTSGLALPDGFRLVALVELAGRERDVHGLYAEAYADQPTDQALTNVRFEEWVTDTLGDPQLSKQGSFVVLAGETPAALAWIKVVGKRAQNDLTGTARAYRRRGLARAAKLATIRWCAEHGIERIATGNDSTNVGMLAINRELGYRPWITSHVYGRRV